MTTIREFAARLDDYTGNLSQAVEKLEIERARGILNLDEQMDLVGDLRRVIQDRWIRPWRRRAVMAWVLGLLLLATAFLLPQTLPQPGPLPWAAAGVGVLILAWGGYGAGKVHHFRQLECAWLREVETTVQRGGTVFDVG